MDKEQNKESWKLDIVGQVQLIIENAVGFVMGKSVDVSEPLIKGLLSKISTHKQEWDKEVRKETLQEIRRAIELYPQVAGSFSSLPKVMLDILSSLTNSPNND